MVDDEHIPSVMEQVERMNVLTRSLLDLSQLEASATEIQSKDVDLAALLREFAEPYASQVPRQ